MVDVVVVAVGVILAIALVQLVTPRVRLAMRKSGRLGGPRPARRGGYEWDRRRDQLYRSVKGIGGVEVSRDEILRFLDSHRGVEAYVEPKTVMHPLSVVLVDVEGEAKRFHLEEDALLRELARTHALPVFDATRVGYPERMRRRRSEG